MEAAARLPLNNSVDIARDQIDWSKCIICQENKFPKKKFPLSKGSSTGISRIFHCANIRQECCNDKENNSLIGIVEKLNKKEENQDVVWHRTCYSDFTSEGHIKKQESEKKMQEEAMPDHLPSRRSLLRGIDWTKCMFCQTDIKRVVLNQVQTLETSQKILEKAESDRELSCRLAGVNDLVAAEGRYHLKCYTRFQRNTKRNSQSCENDPAQRCFEESMALLRKRLSEGHIFSLKAVWTYYSRTLEEKYQLLPGEYRSNRFKDKVQGFLGEDVTFIPPFNPSEPHLIIYANLGEAALRSLLKTNQRFDLSDESDDDELNNDATEDVDLDAELISWLYRVAVKVHHDIKNSPSHDCIGKISQTSAEEIVPESLLISLLCTGYQDNIEESHGDMKTRILSICQDILFLASNGHKLTPKHIGLGLTLHQATRSKQLVQLLYSAGHSVNYETVLRMDNTIANNVLKRYKESGNVFVPRNFMESTQPERYTRYAVDNIDINEETLSGMRTFHATQVAAFRRKKEGEQEMNIDLSPKSDRRLDLQMSSELHELAEFSLDNTKPEPVIEREVSLDWYTPDTGLIDESYKKNLAWILSRLHEQQPDLQTIPGWTGFNQLLSTDEPQVTVVGPLPIVNAPAHEFETLWTVIRRCKAMTQLRNTKFSVITMDEGLYNKAKMLQWGTAHVLKDVIIMLGGFHTQVNFSKVIGEYLGSSGIAEIWAESEVFGETTAGNILKGKVWNRVIRAHKLTLEALWRVLWPILRKWALEDRGDECDAQQNLSDRLAAEYTDGNYNADSPLFDEVGGAVQILNSFDAAHQEDYTFRYWRQYMKLVSLLLSFTSALREGKWDLYLATFSRMLPYFAAFDHTNYTRWGIIFLTDMKMLPHTAPDIQQAFERGDFVTKETDNTFNQIPDDQALEHINRSGKVAGGLVGITRTDSARDRWCLTYNERAKLSDDTKCMFNVAEKEDTNTKDLGKSRMRRDAEDVLKLEAQFKKYNVFRCTSDLVVVTTGDVASDAIKQDLIGAEIIGKKAIREFVERRLIKKETKFHDPLRQRKLKTFETLYTISVSVDKSKTIALKADKDLLRRVIVALESGRDVDVDTLLQSELSTVPKSLATLNGNLREVGKSDLGTILQKNVSQTQRPMSQIQTCTIIDGMAAVQSLGNTTRAKTFGEWSDQFLRFVTSHFSANCTRVDVVFDRYVKNSIKGGTREKRKEKKNAGIPRNVESRDQKIGNWEKFIILEENKASLAHFISTEITQSFSSHPGQELVLSGGFSDARKVWSSDVSRINLGELSSDHEEADTRIILHAQEATERGYRQVNVICRDTDVLVLLLAHRQQLCEEVWMFSGTSRKRCFIPIHRIPLTEEKKNSLLAFHAITGCDTTSQFYGVGKSSAWKVFDIEFGLLKHLGKESPISEGVLADAEAFVCKLYNPRTQEVEINKERAAAFRTSKQDLDSLPPTQDALILHIRRANYQTMIWKKALTPCPSLPKPEDSGWYYSEDILKPKLMTQQEMSASCSQLAYCGCSREGGSCVNRRCTCVRLSLCCSKAC